MLSGGRWGCFGLAGSSERLGKGQRVAGGPRPARALGSGGLASALHQTDLAAGLDGYRQLSQTPGCTQRSGQTVTQGGWQSSSRKRRRRRPDEKKRNGERRRKTESAASPATRDRRRMSRSGVGPGSRGVGPSRAAAYVTAPCQIGSYCVSARPLSSLSIPHTPEKTCSV